MRLELPPNKTTELPKLHLKQLKLLKKTPKTLVINVRGFY